MKWYPKEPNDLCCQLNQAQISSFIKTINYILLEYQCLHTDVIIICGGNKSSARVGFTKIIQFVSITCNGSIVTNKSKIKDESQRYNEYIVHMLCSSLRLLAMLNSQHNKQFIQYIVNNEHPFIALNKYYSEKNNIIESIK